MKSLRRNFIIFYLIVAILGAFAFHWFFIDKMMPVIECFSTNCAYSSIQTIIPPETINILLIALLVVVLIAFIPSTKIFDNKFKKMPGRMFLEWKIDGFYHKLISWLKILEKRDPQTALVVARIFDFRQ